MGVWEILLIIACAAIVISVITTSIIRKKQGKNSCSGNCSQCSGCKNTSDWVESYRKKYSK